VTHDALRDEIHRRLGYRRLSRSWAKAEILLGLLAAGVGQLLGIYSVTRESVLWEFAVPSLALFVLGGYLTLAGHRSHLYQSSNERLALLLEESRQSHSKGSPT
jgi:hypothetical protein